MTYSSDHECGWIGPGDELVERLRRLDWPKPDAELRERCWREFRQQAAEHPPATERRAVDAARPLEYTLRPRAMRGHVPAERLRAARGLSRRRALLAV